MADVLMRFRILPKDVDTDLKEILELVKSNLKDASVVSSREEPIAFGINALILDVRAKDEEGVPDRVENAIKRSTLVSQADIIAVSRC